MGALATLLGLMGISKVPAVVIELLVVAALAAAGAFYVSHLHTKAAKYDALWERVSELQHKYGCKQDLALCLAARDEEALRKQAAWQQMAVSERKRADDANSQLVFAAKQVDDQIDKSDAPDGAVPVVMQEEWDRERAAQGVK